MNDFLNGFQQPVFSNVENRCIRGDDGKEYWLSRSHAVCVQVRAICPVTKEHRILITKRAAGTNIGQWCMPCGYLDHSETRLEAARRELYEETGLYLPTSCFVRYREEDRPEKDALQNIVTHYYVIYTVPNLTTFEDMLKFDEHEVSEGGLYTVEEISAMDLAFGHRDLILNF
jgi:8-oxo-dGTP pyrophosphatase MutT (NUDIX family)